MSAFSAASSTLASFVKSIARVPLASRPALNNLFESARDAPLKKLIFTWSLNAPSAQTRPLEVHTAVPHFTSSVRVGSAALITLRNRPQSAPRQSPSSANCSVICWDAEATSFDADVFLMFGAVLL